jgi:uncharacterized protein (DUF3084 family)
MNSTTYNIYHPAKITSSTKYALKKASKIVKNRTKNIQNRQKSHQNRTKTFASRTFFLSTIKSWTVAASETRHRFEGLNAKDLSFSNSI